MKPRFYLQKDSSAAAAQPAPKSMTRRNRLGRMRRMGKEGWSKLLFGTGEGGLIYKGAVYILLISLGFVFLYPLLSMLSYSFMTPQDLLNPLVGWIPSDLYTGNYDRALAVLDYWRGLTDTLMASVIPAAVQTIAAALIGYGFAKFEFPGKRFWFFLVIATFVIPPQVTTIPQYLTYSQLKLLDSLLAYVLPAAFGQGLRSAIFILIFWSFFRMVPKSLEEAAQVDGAGPVKVFFSIAVPTAVPGFIISFLFGFVWYWNETYLATMFFGSNIRTLPMRLQQFVTTYSRMYGNEGPQGQTSNEAIEMAGTFLIILPLLLFYFVTQRWFVESVDRSGITGE